MQFVANGPDIPDELLQAHEEGRVVFFCGAGISYPAGLPGFKGLVEQIYQLEGTTLSPFEQEAFDRWQFDATLDLLERRIPGQRLTVRRRLAEALKPDLTKRGSTDTHKALLTLARSRAGSLRLVTTNFDRVFHTAAKRSRITFNEHAAPMLPIPKNSRWNGLVYLHGLLTEKPDDTALHKLVVTSGDFGLAYLTERWAARFVSELFRNYVVCFVGYSINDPVLRYMMDALAADRMLGEITPKAWALGDCVPGQEKHKTIEWEAKGVTPVLYEVQPGTFDHSALHLTLKAWSETYRDGVTGKERIVVSHALAKPSASTRQDDFVGRVLWAISDKSGLPAKTFADFNPAPPLDWLLEAFSDARYQHGDLVRFGVPPRDEVNKKLAFCLVDRPAPYPLAPQMMLASGGLTGTQWDDVMLHIARWLVRHLNDPRLILWIAQKGSHLHERWRTLIEQELDRFDSLVSKNNTLELDEIRLHAPNAVPSSLMRTLWRLLLCGRVQSPWNDSNLYQWMSRLKRDGLSTSLRLELRELLAPKVTLKKPFHWAGEDVATDEATKLRQLVDCELVLSTPHVYSDLLDIDDTHWAAALPLLLEDFQQLLRDALDLLVELGEADDHSDRSYWDLPSVHPHWQNRGFRDWVKLIELLRDAWLKVRDFDSIRATRTAQLWFDLPYSTFKRLALYAASKDNCISTDEWTRWLLADAGWWLWSVDTKREVYRLLVLQGANLSEAAQEHLEAAILAGPPREMYRSDLDEGRWSELVSSEVWLHLAKLNSSGVVLGATAASSLEELSRSNPNWRLAPNESDEFSHWMSGTGDPGFEDNRTIAIAPRKRNELIQWLLDSPTNQGPYDEDTWREVCRTRFFHSLHALQTLSQRDVWPSNRWREALQVWSEESMATRSWKYAAPLMLTMPDAVIQEIVHGVAWWIESASKTIRHHEDLMLDLSRKILDLPLDAGSGMTRNGALINQPVTEAINHPIGLVTRALLNLWLIREPNDNDGLPADISTLFTRLCDTAVVRYRHGRVLLGSRLISLFRVDRPWTEQHLLPLLNWSAAPLEAKAIWEGFLWSPRLYRPLLMAFKTPFLDTANHYSSLGEHAQQYASFLTYAALAPVEGFTAKELQTAIALLPQEGLEQSAQALVQALEGAGSQREEYWINRIKPFWQRIWPKSRELVTRRISTSLARMAIAAGNEFPAALAAVEAWLSPLDHPDYGTHRLYESGLCNRFPNETLRLLSIIMNDESWVPSKLGECLDQIIEAAPALANAPECLRLREYARKRLF